MWGLRLGGLVALRVGGVGFAAWIRTGGLDDERPRLSNKWGLRQIIRKSTPVSIYYICCQSATHIWVIDSNMNHFSTEKQAF